MNLTPEEQQTYGGAMASVMLDGSPTLEMVEALCKIIDRLAAAEANARTPGTVEVCITRRGLRCPNNIETCDMRRKGEGVCPLRTKDTP